MNSKHTSKTYYKKNTCLIAQRCIVKVVHCHKRKKEIQSKCPLRGKWFTKLWHRYKIQNYALIKNREKLGSYKCRQEIPSTIAEYSTQIVE